MMRPYDEDLGTETVEGSSLSLESVDDVEGGDRLSLGVLGVLRGKQKRIDRVMVSRR